MIRLVGTRLTLPKGDTGFFMLPIRGQVDKGDIAVFSVKDPLTRTTVVEKYLNAFGTHLLIHIEHEDTMNLAAGKYFWDVKIYRSPIFDEDSLEIIGRYFGGACCVFGHLYPLYFGFKGGKGVMTSLGLILILDIRVALICLSVFILVVLLSRMVSLSSVLAVAVAPFIVYAFGTYVDHRSPLAVAFCVGIITVIVVTVIVKHRTNIVRIIKGTESKLNFKKK